MAFFFFHTYAESSSCFLSLIAVTDVLRKYEVIEPSYVFLIQAIQSSPKLSSAWKQAVAGHFYELLFLQKFLKLLVLYFGKMLWTLWRPSRVELISVTNLGCHPRAAGLLLLTVLLPALRLPGSCQNEKPLLWRAFSQLVFPYLEET